VTQTTPPIMPALEPTHSAELSKPARTAGRARTIVALVLREMSTRYGKSPGGYIWAILEPMGMIIVLSFGFSLLLRSPSLGNSFILFYATGYLAYNLFLKLSQVVANSLNFSRALLTYPAVGWIDAVGARIVLNVLTNVLVSYLLLGGIILLVDNRVVLSYGPILQAYCMAIALGIGVGLVNAVIISFFPVWQTVWGVITRPLFLASGIIVIFEELPPVAQNILAYNPLMHVVGQMHRGFYPMYNPQYIDKIYVMVIALVLVALGLMLMRRFHKRILNR
jgi:capsular polysaccharide transport system permease protein